MAYIEYLNGRATRNRKLSPKLVNAMSFLGSMGVTMKVVSGGQAGKGEKGGRVGSTRHDHGNAADADFYMNGRRLVWSKPADKAILAEIVTKAVRNGVTGIGAGDSYMGDGRIHLGFGSAATWGGGKGVAAPAWLRNAYAIGRGSSKSSASQNVQMVANNAAPQEALPDPRLSMSAPQLLKTLRQGKDKRSDIQLLYELSNNNGLAGREIKTLLAQGNGLGDIAGQLGLKVPSNEPQPTALPSFEDFEASYGAPQELVEAPSFEEFSASYEQEQPQEPVEPPSFEDFAASYEPTEQPTQTGDAWQTQKTLSDSTLSERKEKAPLMQESSWELPS